MKNPGSTGGVPKALAMSRKKEPPFATIRKARQPDYK
jgi:hypothetical protein